MLNMTRMFSKLSSEKTKSCILDDGQIRKPTNVPNVTNFMVIVEKSAWLGSFGTLKISWGCIS